jgi:hypothetical protein
MQPQAWTTCENAGASVNTPAITTSRTTVKGVSFERTFPISQEHGAELQERGSVRFLVRQHGEIATLLRDRFELTVLVTLLTTPTPTVPKSLRSC